MKPKNISLALYLETKARLNKARFPHTFTLTRWINQAICDKLNREHPETVGVSPMERPTPVSPLVVSDPMAERAEKERQTQMQELEALKEPQASISEALEGPPAVPMAKLAEDQETDFWGDDEAYQDQS